MTRGPDWFLIALVTLVGALMGLLVWLLGGMMWR